MIENAIEIFNDRDALLRKIKKSTYPANMEVFRSKYEHYITEMLDSLKASSNKEEQAAKMAEDFCMRARENYLKKGKMPYGVQMDLSFVMIYYVFPAILLTGDEDAIILADAIKNAWNKVFVMDINYSSYEEMYAGFKTKLFGLF